MSEKETKLDEKKCFACYGKRFYSVLIGITGHEDFGGDGFVEYPAIKNVACPKCNKGNKLKLKGVHKSIW